MKLKDFQDKFNSYTEVIANSKKSISELKKEALSLGFYFADGTFKSNSTAIGCVYNYAYYSRYVGEKGAMYDGADYACTIDQTLDIEALGLELNVLKEKALKSMKEATPGPGWIPNPMTPEEFENFFKKFDEYYPEYISYPILKSWKYQKEKSDIYTSSNTLSKVYSYDTERFIKDCTDFIECFEYENGRINYRYCGRSRPEECVNGSGFTIGLFDKQYLDTYKEESYEDKFDVYNHRDTIEWKKLKI